MSRPNRRLPASAALALCAGALFVALPVAAATGSSPSSTSASDTATPSLVEARQPQFVTLQQPAGISCPETQYIGDWDADGTPNYIQTSNYDADGNLLVRETDTDGDGTPNRRNTFAYDADGRQILIEFDTNADGIVDERRTQELIDGYWVTTTYDPADGPASRYQRALNDADGNRLLYQEDLDADGTWEYTAKSVYNASGYQIESLIDNEGDGVYDRRTVNYWTDDGQFAGSDTDQDNDGVIDRTLRIRFENGGLRRIEETDDNADGTVDSRAVVDLDADGREIFEGSDENADGIYEESAFYEYDEQGRFVAQRGDEDGDGVFDFVSTIEYSPDGSSSIRRTDQDGDGTIDRIATDQLDVFGRATRTEYDDDADGTIDSIVTSDFECACHRGRDAACLLGGAFSVEGWMRDFQTPPKNYDTEVMTFATPRAQTSQAVFFESFTPGNFEVGVKMVDGCGLAPGNPLRAYWIFAGGLTNAYTALTVTDTATGNTFEWMNPAGNFPTTIGDTGALPCAGGTPSCSDSDTRACLLDGRFAVEGIMEDFSDPPAAFDLRVMDFATLRAETKQAVFFDSFSEGNFEVGVKMVDACDLPTDNPLRAYWAFYGGLTNAETEIRITQLETGLSDIWANPEGAFPTTEGRTAAFPCID